MGIARYLRSLAAIAVIVLSGCTADDLGGSLYDPEDEDFAPVPQITSIDPANWAFGGITDLVIHGQNFSPNPDDNVVFIGAERVEVLEASSERLVVAAPELYSDDLTVRVTVNGALEFAEVGYELRRAVVTVGGLLPIEAPQSITSDAAGNIYVALTATGSPAGVDRISPDGSREDYLAPEQWTYSDMVVGDDGSLYLVRGAVAGIYVAAPGATTPSILANLGRGNNVGAIDIDEVGNIWAAGSGGSIHRVSPDEEVTSFPLAVNASALRIVDEFVYVAGAMGDVSGVWRASLNAAGDPGAFELHFDASEFYAPQEVDVLALAFAEDGSMFVGTDGSDPIVLVEPNGNATRFYSALNDIQPTIAGFAWGEGSYLYAVRRVNTERSTEPGAVLRIDTQRQGRN